MLFFPGHLFVLFIMLITEIFSSLSCGATLLILSTQTLAAPQHCLAAMIDFKVSFYFFLWCIFTEHEKCKHGFNAHDRYFYAENIMGVFV